MCLTSLKEGAYKQFIQYITSLKEGAKEGAYKQFIQYITSLKGAYNKLARVVLSFGASGPQLCRASGLQKSARGPDISHFFT